jgi:hypothetical protein
MWCEVSPDTLNAFIDGEVPALEAAAIQAHVAECAVCRAELERSRMVDDAIRRHAPDPGLPAMREALLRRVAPARRRLVIRVAAAAAVAAAFVVGLRLRDGSERPHDGPAAAAPGDSGKPILESLELDAASLRLTLVAEDPDPEVRRDLDARLDAVVRSLEELRAKVSPDSIGEPR